MNRSERTEILSTTTYIEENNNNLTKKYCHFLSLFDLKGVMKKKAIGQFKRGINHCSGALPEGRKRFFLFD